MPANVDPILSNLSADLYLSGAEVSERYASDWSGSQPQLPPVVLRPRSTEDVSMMLRLCHQANQRVAVQGGLTGLSGGATPQIDEWALSLERLTQPFEVDSAGMTMRCGAGVILEKIHAAAAEHGLRLPLDLGARGSAVAGGLVSTNAGGNQVIQFGMARAMVLGLVAVLADGTIIPAKNTLLKNNAGFDLKQLFIGSEGTLGVVTEIEFRLFPVKAARTSALCTAENFPAVLDLLARLGRDLGAVRAFEVMWLDYFKRACMAAGQTSPLDTTAPYVILIETEGANADRLNEEIEQALGGALEAEVISDCIVAQSGSQAATFWEIRDGVSELIPEMAPLANFDIGIPMSSMEQFTGEAMGMLAQQFPDAEVLIFGHIADGNLHILASNGDAGDAKKIYAEIYGLVGKYQGTVTAEHGVGTLKREYLANCRSAEEISLMRQLKLALDPKNILNANRVIPADT